MMASYTWKAGVGDTGWADGHQPRAGHRARATSAHSGQRINAGSYCDASAPRKRETQEPGAPPTTGWSPGRGSRRRNSTGSELRTTGMFPAGAARYEGKAALAELLEESSYTRVGCWKELSSLVWAAQEQPGSGHGSLKGSRGCSNPAISW